MRRRTFLATVSGGVGLSISGCLTDERASSDDTPTVTDYLFEMTSASETPDDPAVTNVVANWPTAEVTIEGTVTVKNGCTVLAIGSEPAVVTEDSVVEVGIETREEGEMCTQALQDIGYRLSVSYEEACPRVVRVTHPGQEAVELSLNCL